MSEMIESVVVIVYLLLVVGSYWTLSKLLDRLVDLDMGGTPPPGPVRWTMLFLSILVIPISVIGILQLMLQAFL